MARLLRVRHEKGRNRTRERALVHMELLMETLAAPAQTAQTAQTAQPAQPAQPAQQAAGAEGASGSSDGVGAGGTATVSSGNSSGAAAVAAARMPYVYCLSVPLQPRLRKELAEQYMSLGFVGGCSQQACMLAAARRVRTHAAIRPSPHMPLSGPAPSWHTLGSAHGPPGLLHDWVALAT